MNRGLQGALSNDFHGVLRGDLAAAGLLLCAPDHASARRRALERGFDLWLRVRLIIGERCWRRAQKALRRPLQDDECGRVLGFGAALTEFATAPLASSQEIVELGALANFIVGIYDTHLDAWIEHRPLLDRAKLIRLFTVSRRLWSLGSPMRRVSAPERMFVALVSEFVRRLRAVAGPRACERDFDSILRAIVAMYDAQDACVRLRAKVPQRKLRDKGALPMVVMGAPAWLGAARADEASVAWHGRWLYDLGEFLALIDDSVDLYPDATAGEPNRIERILRRDHSPRRVKAIAAAIARRGAKLQSAWHARLPSQARHASAEILPMVVTSWLEGAT